MVEFIIAIGVSAVLMLALSSYMAQNQRDMFKSRVAAARDDLMVQLQRQAITPEAIAYSAFAGARAGGGHFSTVIPDASPPRVNLAGNKRLLRCVLGLPVGGGASDPIQGPLPAPSECPTSLQPFTLFSKKVGELHKPSATIPMPISGPDHLSADRVLYTREGNRAPAGAVPDARHIFALVTEFRGVCEPASLTAIGAAVADCGQIGALTFGSYSGNWAAPPEYILIRFQLRVVYTPGAQQQHAMGTGTIQGEAANSALGEVMIDSCDILKYIESESVVSDPVLADIARDRLFRLRCASPTPPP